MLFLLLALLSSSVLALVLKYLNTSSPYGVYLVNYITCTLLPLGPWSPGPSSAATSPPAGWGR